MQMDYRLRNTDDKRVKEKWRKTEQNVMNIYTACVYDSLQQRKIAGAKTILTSGTSENTEK